MSQTEILGVWELTPGSLEDIDAMRYRLEDRESEHTITVRPDGSCRFSSVYPRDTNRSFDRIDSECTWFLNPAGDGQELAQELAIEIPGFGYSRIHYDFDDAADGSLVLWQYLSDPDAWRYLEYRKSPQG